jgi:spore maturation protein CgeB
MAVAASCDVGLALVPLADGDHNMRTMPGASNKVFDYLGAGLALLVTDLPEWNAAYVDTGLARACVPGDTDSVAAALEWFAVHPERRRLMGNHGRERVLQEWNYDVQFESVRELLLRPR